MRGSVALSHFQKACELYPDNGDSWGNHGMCLLLIGKTDEAIASLEKAIKLKPAYKEAHYNLGQAYINKCMWDKAISYFEEAWKYGFDKIRVTNKIASCIATQNNDEISRMTQKGLDKIAAQVFFPDQATGPLMAHIVPLDQWRSIIRKCGAEPPTRVLRELLEKDKK